MKISLKESKSIITPSKLPGSDYVVNPYTGCAFGCLYCYADFTRKFTGHMDDKWGEFIDVKSNTVELFAKEFQKISLKIIKKNDFKSGDKPVLFFGSVTDPYQGVEATYQLTRKCLEIVANSKIKNDVKISLLTKSPLVTRDIDILKRIPNLEVGLTITSTDDKISRLLERYALPSSVRIKALKMLNSAGLNTYAFVGPLLPHFVIDEKSLRDLFKNIKETGTKRVWAEHINLTGSKMLRLIEMVGDQLDEKEKKLLVESQSDEYKMKLSGLVMKIVRELGLELVGGKVVDHVKLEK